MGSAYEQWKTKRAELDAKTSVKDHKLHTDHKLRREVIALERQIKDERRGGGTGIFRTSKGR